MNDTPVDTQTPDYYDRLNHAIDSSRTTLQLLNEEMANGPNTTRAVRSQAASDHAHKELLSAITDYLPHFQPQILTLLLPSYVGRTSVVATTNWVQDYVAKHLQPAPTTHSWSSPTNLAIAVLSGVLGGLIAAILGAVLVLILP